MQAFSRRFSFFCTRMHSDFSVTAGDFSVNGIDRRPKLCYTIGRKSTSVFPCKRIGCCGSTTNITYIKD